MSSVSAVNNLLGSTATTTSSSVNISSILAATTGATTPGIDVAGAVASSIFAARAPERIWQAQQATLASQTTALTAIQTATTALTTDMNSLNSLTGPLSARTVSSSNPSGVTATAASGTLAGTHSVVVQNVATTASWYSDLEASPSASLPTSSLTLTNVSGASATITTGTGGAANLTALAAAVTAATDSSGNSLGLTATVVSDSTGSRLAIISNKSGSAADFSIVSSNATGVSWSSPSIAKGQSLGANSLVLTVGASQTTITTTQGETLAAVASDINANVSGVTASVVSDSNGSHLLIASTDGTTPFTINEPNFGFSQSSVGLNAALTVDGVPISSANNSVSGAIPGVTLNLLGPTSQVGATLTVASDATQASNAINQFVSDYNTAIGLVNAQFTYNAGTASQGVLGSDPTIRGLQNALMQALSYSSAPATGPTPAISNLSNLGVSLGQDGTLSVDTATLTSALVNHASDVQTFLQGSALNGFASSMATQLSSFTNPGSGAVTVDLRSISNTNSALTSQISTYETLFIANQQIVLTAMYSKAEVALQQLPTQMAQINAELGNTTKSS